VKVAQAHNDLDKSPAVLDFEVMGDEPKIPSGQKPEDRKPIISGAPWFAYQSLSGTQYRQLIGGAQFYLATPVPARSAVLSR